MAAGIAIKITAVDAATKRIDAITKRIEGMNAPAKRITLSLSRLGAATGLGKLSRGFGDIARRSADAARNITRIVEPLGLIAGAASIAGMYRLIGSWATFSTQLGFSAQRMGITADRLMSLQGSARLAGSSAGALSSGLENMGQVLYDAVGGRNAEAVVLMNTLGVSFRGVGMHARSVTDVLPEMVDKIAAIKDPYAQAQAATVMFGGAAKDLLPWIRQGSKGMAEYEALARSYGVVNGKAAASALDFTRAQTELELSGEGLRNTIAQGLEPAIARVLRRLASWVNRLRQNPEFERGLARIARWLDTLDFDKLEKAIEQVWDRIKGVVGEFDNWQSRLGTIAEYMAGAWLLSVSNPILRVLRLLALIPGSGVTAAMVGAAAVSGDTPTSGPGAPAANRAKELQTHIETLQYRMKQGGLTGDERLGMRNEMAADQRELDTIRGRNGLSWWQRHMPDIGFGSPRTSAPGNSSDPRGIRNNNPLNLSYVPGQAGLDPNNPSDGRFGRYSSMEAGVASADRQLLRYQQQGLSTVRQMVSRWAPPSENDTGSYVAAVSRSMGVDPDAPVDLHNQTLASSMIAAMAQRENGRSIDQAIIQRGVAMAEGVPALGVASGAPAQLAQQPSTADALHDALANLRGSADVNIRLSGAPAGTQTVATARGDLFSGPPRVEHAMSGL